MKFQIVDTEAAYRRLLQEPDAAKRETIFREQLIEPFSGLTQFFGGDGAAAFAGWGMSTQQFDDAQRAQTASIVDALAKADAWNRAAASLEKGWAAFASVADRVSLDKIIFGLYLSALVPSPPGYTGFGGIPGWIMTVYGVPDAYNLQRVEAATVHELHHNIIGATQNAAVDWQTAMTTITVGDYMVGEGLAESFSGELYGDENIGPWVTDFDDSDLERVRAMFRDAIHLTGFDTVRRYLYGDAEAGIPKTAGYAIGYRVVQAYLKRTGKGVVETSFVPAKQIIAESGFFE